MQSKDSSSKTTLKGNKTKKFRQKKHYKSKKKTSKNIKGFPNAFTVVCQTKSSQDFTFYFTVRSGSK